MYGHMNFKNHILFCLFVYLDKSLRGLTKQLDKLILFLIIIQAPDS